jgi:hypothetical protein
MCDIADPVSEAVRLAPSAMNSQPWKLEISAHNVKIKYFGRGLLKAVLKKKMSKIDIGIAARHAELALLNDGKKIKSITPYVDGNGFGSNITFE